MVFSLYIYMQEQKPTHNCLHISWFWGIGQFGRRQMPIFPPLRQCLPRIRLHSGLSAWPLECLRHSLGFRMDCVVLIQYQNTKTMCKIVLNCIKFPFQSLKAEVILYQLYRPGLHWPRSGGSTNVQKKNCLQINLSKGINSLEVLG